MAGTTTHYGLAYPTAGDPLYLGAQQMQTLAEDIDEALWDNAVVFTNVTALDGRLDVLEGYNAGTRLTSIEGVNTTQNSRLTTLEGYNANTRLNTLEGYNAGSRLTTLEGYNANTRLNTLEGYNAGTRLTSLETLTTTQTGQLNNLRAGQVAFTGTAETTTSTAYTNLATVGPSVSVTLTEARVCAVVVSAECYQTGAANSVWMSYDTSGATVSSSADNRALKHNGNGQSEAYSRVTYLTLSAGTTTFTAKYKVTAGTGQFSNRTLIVIPM